MRRSNEGRYTTDEERITNEYIRNRIRYLDPDLSHCDRTQADVIGIIACLLVVLAMAAIGLCLHFSGL
jgi:hypothetical protein